MLTNYLIEYKPEVKNKINRIQRVRKDKKGKHTTLGVGELCPKCSKPMERRGHKNKPLKNFFYVKWDYCENCKHVQHYEHFKSSDWQEFERQNNFLKSI